MASTDTNERSPARWRTPCAIGLAAAAGIPVGVFLCASAVPFGRALFGWFVALLSAVVIPLALGLLATHSFVRVAAAYAAGVATAVVIVIIATAPGGVDLGPIVQFGIICMIVGCVAGLAGLLGVLIKWEDKKEREIVMSNLNPVCVADIEGPWAEPDLRSSLIERCKQNWNVPISKLSNAALATFLRQQIALSIVIPEVRRRLEAGIDDDSEKYDGELLAAYQEAILVESKKPSVSDGG